MKERRQDKVMRHDVNVSPWEQGHAGNDEHPGHHFEARFKRRYIVLLVLLLFGFASMGFGIGDEGTREMFFALSPFVIIPLCIRYTGGILAILLGIIIPFLVFFTWPDLVVLLGTIVVILIFGIFLPALGLLWLVTLFDRRPQLVIGPDGICCRQYSDDVIPWNDISYVHVSTHEGLWVLKVKSLVISLRNFSCYPKPSSFWTPQYLLYTLFKFIKKPDDRASVHVSGVVLDPPLPVVMKVIDRYRSQEGTEC